MCTFIPSKIQHWPSAFNFGSTYTSFTMCTPLSLHMHYNFQPPYVHLHSIKSSLISKLGSWHFKNLHVKTTHVHNSKLVPTKGTYQLKVGHEITRNTKCYIMIPSRWPNFLMTTTIIPPHKVSNIGIMIYTIWNYIIPMSFYKCIGHLVWFYTICISMDPLWIHIDSTHTPSKFPTFYMTLQFNFGFTYIPLQLHPNVTLWIHFG
jgi:hypothetical protein